MVLNNEIRIAEVHFFILLARADGEIPLALVSVYSKPHPGLLGLSSNTLYLCKYLGDSALQFIDIKMIQAVMAMVPYMPAIGPQEPMECYFLVEKPGFDVSLMVGIEEVVVDKPELSAQMAHNDTAAL
jgi:hypothetical protein